MPPRKLRAVTDADTPARVAPTTVRQAADEGTQRELLSVLRTRIASDIDSPNTPPRDLAALSRRLLEIDRDIRALDAARSKDAIGAAAEVADEAFSASS